MLSGVMLIIVTMFAVLGAYYLSDMLTACLFKHKKMENTVVLLATDSLEQMWNGVLDIRAKLPDSEIIVLCASGTEIQPLLEPSMRGVTFATPDNVGAAVCARLAVNIQPCEAQ